MSKRKVSEIQNLAAESSSSEEDEGSSSAGSEEEDSDGSSSSYMDHQELSESFEVNVDLECFFPTERDYSAVYQFMKEYQGIANFAAGDIAKWFTTDSDAGSVIKAADGEVEALGFLTVLSYAQHKDKTAIQQLEKELLHRVPGKRKKELEALLSGDKPLGLIISQRLVNLPSSLAPPLHKSLYDEVKWVLDNEKDRKDFQFANYLLLGTKMKSVPKGKRKAEAPAEEETVWPKEEEELYWQHAHLKFEWPIHRDGKESRWTMMGDMREFGAAMVVSSTEIPALLLELDGWVEALAETEKAKPAEEEGKQKAKKKK